LDHLGRLREKEREAIFEEIQKAKDSESVSIYLQFQMEWLVKLVGMLLTGSFSSSRECEEVTIRAQTLFSNMQILDDKKLELYDVVASVLRQQKKYKEGSFGIKHGDTISRLKGLRNGSR